MIVLVSLTAFKKVEQKEYGIVYNNFTKQFGRVYEQGTYTLNVGDVLFKKDRTLIDVGLNTLNCISKDKITITLTLSAQYQLNKQDLIDVVLKQFDEKYDTFLSSIVSNIILRVCGFYNAEEFYLTRGVIDINMFNALINEINNSTRSLGSTIVNFQLQNIRFPQSYEDAITQKQLVIQNMITSQNNRTTQLILANTSLLQNQRQAQILIINANNQAQILINQAQTSYDIIVDQWTQRSAVYASIMTNLKLNQSQFLEYLKAEAIRDSESPVISV
jgi:regulator of protease activity HflC (stomatin/prohibitin superfamily)